MYTHKYYDGCIPLKMSDNLYKIIVTVILHKTSDNFSSTVYSFCKVYKYMSQTAVYTFCQHPMQHPAKVPCIIHKSQSGYVVLNIAWTFNIFYSAWLIAMCTLYDGVTIG